MTGDSWDSRWDAGKRGQAANQSRIDQARAAAARMGPIRLGAFGHLNPGGQGAVRIGDAERDQAMRALGEHFAAGRLDHDEYDVRMQTAIGAKTHSELAVLFADLPLLPAPQPPPPPRHPLQGKVLPIVLLLVGVAILFGNQWIFWVGLGLLLWTRNIGAHRWHHRHGDDGATGPGSGYGYERDRRSRRRAS